MLLAGRPARPVAGAARQERTLVRPFEATEPRGLPVALAAAPTPSHAARNKDSEGAHGRRGWQVFARQGQLHWRAHT